MPASISHAESPGGQTTQTDTETPVSLCVAMWPSSQLLVDTLADGRAHLQLALVSRPCERRGKKQPDITGCAVHGGAQGQGGSPQAAQDRQVSVCVSYYRRASSSHGRTNQLTAPSCSRSIVARPVPRQDKPAQGAKEEGSWNPQRLPVQGADDSQGGGAKSKGGSEWRARVVDCQRVAAHEGKRLQNIPPPAR